MAFTEKNHFVVDWGAARVKELNSGKSLRATALREIWENYRILWRYWLAYEDLSKAVIACVFIEDEPT